MKTAGVLETALYVDDLAKSIHFYEALLDCHKLMEDARMCALAIADRQVLLLFRKHGTTEPVATPGGTIPPHDGDGQTHLAFAVAKAELPEWERHLSSLGVPIESRVRWDRGGESLFFRDPDGHLLEVATPGTWAIY